MLFYLRATINILNFLWKTHFHRQFNIFINSFWYFHLPRYTGEKLILLYNSYTDCYLAKQN